MMKLTIILTLFNLYSIDSEAAYTRFWVGLKTQKLDTVKFVGGLNKLFFKQTIEIGKGLGLISYLPYITKMNDSSLPDEIALVVYESEEKYKKIRATEAGKKYTDLHWEYFDPTQSKSTVTEPYVGKLEMGGAYELKPEFQDYQKAKIVVSIYQNDKKTLNELNQNFEALKKQANVLNSVILIRPKYAIEYRAMNQPVLQKLNEKEGALLENKELSAAKFSAAPPFANYGEGVNFQF